MNFHVCASSGGCTDRIGCSLQSPGFGRGQQPSLRETSADLALWHLFQCPRVNGVKAHTNKQSRRQVVLDLQIW